MKRVIFVHCIALLTFCHVKAQIGYGPEIGINLADVKMIAPTSYTTTSLPIVRAKAGGIVDADFTNHFYLQTGLFFTQKGNIRTLNHSNDTMIEAVEEQLAANYIEVPLGVVLKTGLQGATRFFIGLGAAGAYVVGGRDKIHDSGNIAGNAFDSRSNNKVIGGGTIKGFDIGISICMGLELPAGIFIRSSYTAGLNNVSLFLDESDKNKVGSLAIGYYFGKGRHLKYTKDDYIEIE
ncbi:MAG: PorT family protein [Bacteroidetes bacterium]|nr:PorT family protein [Bacteroidota bacterium]